MEKKPFDGKDNDSEIESRARLRRAGSAGGAGTGESAPGAFWNHPVVRVAFFSLCCLAISLLGRFAVNVVYANMHAYPSTRQPYASPYWLVFLPLTGAIAALAALVVLKRREGWSLWKSAGFGSQGAGRAVLVGSLVSLAIAIVTFGITTLLEHQNHAASPGMPRFFALLLAYSLASSLFRIVANETIFHGFFLQELEKRWGTLIGLVV
ncbi:MAG TPA: hypothetical protein VFW40_07205, partial [Capsulimonadaceae bacterium]|nr:hypothetical protein [Capsulimonadaceae bacterium]